MTDIAIYTKADVEHLLADCKKYEWMESWFTTFGDVPGIEIFDAAHETVLLWYKGLSINAQWSWALDYKGYMSIWYLHKTDGEEKESIMFYDDIPMTEKIVRLLTALEQLVQKEQP